MYGAEASVHESSSTISLTISATVLPTASLSVLHSKVLSSLTIELTSSSIPTVPSTSSFPGQTLSAPVPINLLPVTSDDTGYFPVWIPVKHDPDIPTSNTSFGPGLELQTATALNLLNLLKPSNPNLTHQIPVLAHPLPLHSQPNTIVAESFCLLNCPSMYTSNPVNVLCYLLSSKASTLSVRSCLTTTH